MFVYRVGKLEHNLNRREGGSLVRDLSLYYQGYDGGRLAVPLAVGTWRVHGMTAESQGRSERNTTPICHPMYFQKRYSSRIITKREVLIATVHCLP